MALICKHSSLSKESWESSGMICWCPRATLKSLWVELLMMCVFVMWIDVAVFCIIVKACLLPDNCLTSNNSVRLLFILSCRTVDLGSNSIPPYLKPRNLVLRQTHQINKGCSSSFSLSMFSMWSTRKACLCAATHMHNTNFTNTDPHTWRVRQMRYLAFT